MKTYIFKTTATMKPYNNQKMWIDRDIIKQVKIYADNIKDALKQYQSIVKDNYYICISNNALRNKEAMYIDDENKQPKQIGYVITASTKIENDNYKRIKQYINLWVEIITVIDTDFE